MHSIWFGHGRLLGNGIWSRAFCAVVRLFVHFVSAVRLKPLVYQEYFVAALVVCPEWFLDVCAFNSFLRFWDALLATLLL